MISPIGRQDTYLCCGLLYSDGVVLVDDPEHVLVAVIAKLGAELKPRPEVRQDSVAPVAGAEEDLRGNVTLLGAVFCPAPICCAAEARILMQDLEIRQPELGRVIKPRNHMQLKRHVRRELRANLCILVCLIERHETLNILSNKRALGLR